MKESWVSTGLLLLPPVALLAAFFYEASFASYFHIPTDFIQLGWDRVLPALLAATLYYVVIIHFTKDVVERIPSPYYSKLAWGFAPVVIVWACVMVYPDPPLTQPLIVIGLTLFGVLIFGRAFLQKRAIARKTASVNRDQTDKPGRSLPSLANVYLSISWLIVPLALASLLGQIEARWKSTFVVAHLNPAVVLRRYGDTLILAPYDKITARVYGEFQLLDLAAIPSVRFTEQRIGPLKPASADGLKKGVAKAYSRARSSRPVPASD
jgi:hypothetical protein